MIFLSAVFSVNNYERTDLDLNRNIGFILEIQNPMRKKHIVFNQYFVIELLEATKMYIVSKTKQSKTIFINRTSKRKKKDDK